MLYETILTNCTVFFQFLCRQINCSSTSLQSTDRKIKFMTVPSAHRSSSFKQSFRYVCKRSNSKAEAVGFSVCVAFTLVWQLEEMHIQYSLSSCS